MTSSPSPKQQEALAYLLDDETIYIGFGGAAFGGKSYLLCNYITHMALAYPDTGWGIGRKELTTLKKTTLVTLFKVFGEMGLQEKRDYSFNGQLNVITFSNDSQIFLIDMARKPSDPLYTRFGGLELTGAGVDESVEIDLDAITILFTRLGRRNNGKYGIKAKMLETFNPAKNHVYTRYWKPYKENAMPPTRAFVRSLPTDNPSPDVDEYVKNIIANGDTITIERLIKGNFDYDDDPDALISFDAQNDLFTNEFVGQQKPAKMAMTCDVALQGSDSMVIGLWRGFELFEDCELPKTDGKQIVEKITELARNHRIPNSRIVYDADGVGGFLRGFLPGAKAFVNNARPCKIKGKVENYKNLKTQCYYRLAERINSRGMWISKEKTHGQQERIKEELGQVKRYRADKDGKLELLPKEEVKKNIGRSPDYSDMLMMREYLEIMPKAGSGVSYG